MNKKLLYTTCAIIVIAITAVMLYNNKSAILKSSDLTTGLPRQYIQYEGTPIKNEEINNETPVLSEQDTTLLNLQNELKENIEKNNVLQQPAQTTMPSRPSIIEFTATPEPLSVLHVGDTIHLVVTSKDPENRKILYNWWSYTTGGGNLSKIYNSWTEHNEIFYNIQESDIQMSGENFRVGVQMKTDPASNRVSEFDDEIFTDYKFQ